MRGRGDKGVARLRRCEINSIRRELREWYTRPIGRMLLEQERSHLDEILANLFGYHILQAGCLLDDDLLSGSRIAHRIVLDPDCDGDGLSPGVVGYPDAMPVQEDCIDVVLLPHTLEFERDPHEILREVDRILIPEGHVVVVGFNPWSLWGLWRLLNRRNCRVPWCGDFLSLTRLKDWMALLGFDVVSVRRYFYRPPLRSGRIMQRLSFIEKLGGRCCPAVGGGYVLVARKRVATVTPIRPRWRSRRKELVGDLGAVNSVAAPMACRDRNSKSK